MINRLPQYYRKSKVVRDFYDAVKKLLDKISEDISSEDLRLFITTTDTFSLHEKDVGLPEMTADNETKRARVIARLQGNNLLTKAELERLILMYDKTGCTITEDYSRYIVTIQFSGRKGIPYNFEQIHRENHEPIIDRATFEEVQKIIGSKAERHPHIAPYDYQFKDKVFCGNCGAKYYRKKYIREHGMSISFGNATPTVIRGKGIVQISKSPMRCLLIWQSDMTLKLRKYLFLKTAEFSLYLLTETMTFKNGKSTVSGRTR